MLWLRATSGKYTRRVHSTHRTIPCKLVASHLCSENVKNMGEEEKMNKYIFVHCRSLSRKSCFIKIIISMRARSGGRWWRVAPIISSILMHYHFHFHARYTRSTANRQYVVLQYQFIHYYSLFCVFRLIASECISVRHRHLAASSTVLDIVYSALIGLIHLSEKSVIERMLELDDTENLSSNYTFTCDKQSESQSLSVATQEFRL